MSHPDRDRGSEAVRTGIDAVVRQIEAADPEAPTPCVRWSVHDLVRHLEAIAGAYLLWTGSAVGGRIARLRVGDELARYNDLMLERLPTLPLPVHARRFADLATDHLRLARVTWDMPVLETPDDVVLVVGRHAGGVALEWHVHAWDLARSRHDDHRPDDDAVTVMARAWDDVYAGLTGTVRDTGADPWGSLLVASGRTP